MTTRSMIGDLEKLAKQDSQRTKDVVPYKKQETWEQTIGHYITKGSTAAAKGTVYVAKKTNYVAKRAGVWLWACSLLVPTNFISWNVSPAFHKNVAISSTQGVAEGNPPAP